MIVILKTIDQFIFLKSMIQRSDASINDLCHKL